MRPRLLFLVLGAISAAMPLIVAPAASAAPQAVDVTCLGSLTASFNPGVTLASVNQTVTAELKGGTDFQSGVACTSISGIAYQGATATVNLTGMVSCIVGNLSGTGTVKWDNGDISTVSARVTHHRTASAHRRQDHQRGVERLPSGAGGRSDRNLRLLHHAGHSAFLSRHGDLPEPCSRRRLVTRTAAPGGDKPRGAGVW